MKYFPSSPIAVSSARFHSAVDSDSWSEIKDGDIISFYSEYASDEYLDVFFINKNDTFMFSGNEWRIMKREEDEFQPKWLDVDEE